MGSEIKSHGTTKAVNTNWNQKEIAPLNVRKCRIALRRRARRASRPRSRR